MAPACRSTPSTGRSRARSIVDLCEPCQSFWFDGRESLQLSPRSTLALFRIIGERAARPGLRAAAVAKCPRCQGRLRRTQDLQRATRFEYWKCPNEHGRLISFFDFLKEKDFIKPLTPNQISELRQHVQMINCSNCGAPIDLATGSSCPHCRSPLSMLDTTQAEKVVEQLRRADRTGQPVDPALPLALARARAETEAAFAGLPDQRVWLADASASGLVSAGLQALARLLRS